METKKVIIEVACYTSHNYPVMQHDFLFVFSNNESELGRGFWNKCVKVFQVTYY